MTYGPPSEPPGFVLIHGASVLHRERPVEERMEFSECSYLRTARKRGHRSEYLAWRDVREVRGRGSGYRQRRWFQHIASGRLYLYCSACQKQRRRRA